jgi:hypothetical protein
MYCLDADTIINVVFAGWFDNLHESAKNGYICFPEGVYRQLTDTTTRIGNKIKNWSKYGSIHYLTTTEQAVMKQIDMKYGPPFYIIKGKNYPGFWKTERIGSGVDAQIIAVAEECKYMVVSNDHSIHGACMLENVECMRYEEFGRRLIANTLIQSKML